jgi:hypothetical protein
MWTNSQIDRRVIDAFSIDGGTEDGSTFRMVVAIMQRMRDESCDALAAAERENTALRQRVAEFDAALEDSETEIEALRQYVAELEVEQWYEPVPGMRVDMGYGLVLEFGPNGHVFATKSGVTDAICLPDDVRLCRLVSPASDGEGGVQ